MTKHIIKIFAVFMITIYLYGAGTVVDTYMANDAAMAQMEISDAGYLPMAARNVFNLSNPFLYILLFAALCGDSVIELIEEVQNKKD